MTLSRIRRAAWTRGISEEKADQALGYAQALVLAVTLHILFLLSPDAAVVMLAAWMAAYIISDRFPILEEMLPAQVLMRCARRKRLFRDANQLTAHEQLHLFGDIILTN